MKNLIKAIMIVVLALVMVVSTWIIVVAEVTDTTENGSNTTYISDDGDGIRAYQLVWKYKYENSHLYRRRWNATLGIWYDPDWILVY